MATLYRRKNRLWIAWYEGGVRLSRSTGLYANELEKGLKLKADFERELKARLDLGVHRPRTVGAYRKFWIQERRDRGLGTASDDEARLKHAAELEPLRMDEVKPVHFRDLLRRLQREGTLAPRTIRHVYATLRAMFKDAFVEQVIDRNPCEVKRSDLPAKKDKNPAWRATAVYARSEVETLISDTRIPVDRRTLYALLFLTGCRVGELADRRWRDYDGAREPMGCFHVHSSFNTKRRVSKTTKTDDPRQVPVHPVLAQVLGAWKLGGWERMMGRAPGLDDLLIPTGLDARGIGGRERTSNHVRNKLLADLERVGLRARRTHDTRRTFISLALADGARSDVLKWVTHGPSGSVMDLYTTIPWETLCSAVKHLKIRVVINASLALHPTARGGKES